MKYSNLRAFEKHLAGASPDHLSDVYFILGKDEFERKAAAEKLISYIAEGKSDRAMYVHVFEGGKCAAQEILSELHSMAFFTKRRAVLINQADKLDKTACEKLTAYFASPSRTVCLILSAPAINHSTNFYKKGEKAGVVLEIAEEKQWEKEKTSAERLAQIAAAAGKKISPQASQCLLKQIGTDQAVVYNELQKLICYIGERPEITFSDIRAVCSVVNVENIWQLGEAIFRRDTAAALRILKALLLDGSPFLSLLRQLRSQFQTDYQISTILAQGGTPADVAAQFPYMRGIILDKHVQYARGYGLESFKKGLLSIDETDVKAKNSALDPDLLAELLIIRLTG